MNIIASKKWKNNIISIANDDAIYDSKYELYIQNQNKEILTKYKLPTSRIYFGSVTSPNDNMFIFVHYKYNENTNGHSKPTLYIEFYEINENENNHTVLVTLIKEYAIESNFSCSQTVGRLCKINDNLFTVVWSDIYNYDYYNLLTFTKTKYETPIKLLRDELNIEKCYFIDPDLILKPYVLAYKKKYIAIKINNYIDTTQGYIYNDIIELQFNHRFEYNEVDSYIISFQKYNDEYICELRIYLESNLDVLHIDHFNINILLNITTNKVINISEKNRNEDILFFF